MCALIIVRLIVCDARDCANVCWHVRNADHPNILASYRDCTVCAHKIQLSPLEITRQNDCNGIHGWSMPIAMRKLCLVVQHKTSSLNYWLSSHIHIYMFRLLCIADWASGCIQHTVTKCKWIKLLSFSRLFRWHTVVTSGEVTEFVLMCSRLKRMVNTPTNWDRPEKYTTTMCRIGGTCHIGISIFDGFI